MEILLLLLAGLIIGGAVGWYLAEQRGVRKLQEVSEGWERKLKHIEAEVKRADAAHEETKTKLRDLQEQMTSQDTEKKTMESDLAEHRAVEGVSLRSEPATDATPRVTLTPASDLTQIKGIGKVLAGKLGEVGIASIDDLARLDEGEIEAIRDKIDARGPVDLMAWRDAARAMVA